MVFDFSTPRESEEAEVSRLGQSKSGHMISSGCPAGDGKPKGVVTVGNGQRIGDLFAWATPATVGVEIDPGIELCAGGCFLDIHRKRCVGLTAGYDRQSDAILVIFVGGIVSVSGSTGLAVLFGVT